MNLRKGFFSSAATGVLALALAGGGVVFAMSRAVPAPASGVAAVAADEVDPVPLPSEEPEPEPSEEFSTPVEEPVEEPSGCEGSGCGGVEEPEPEPVPEEPGNLVSPCEEGEIEIWVEDEIVECSSEEPQPGYTADEVAYCASGVPVEEQMAWLEEQGYVLRANEDPCTVLAGAVVEIIPVPETESEPSDEPTPADSAP